PPPPRAPAIGQDTSLLMLLPRESLPPPPGRLLGGRLRGHAARPDHRTPQPRPTVQSIVPRSRGDATPRTRPQVPLTHPGKVLRAWKPQVRLAGGVPQGPPGETAPAEPDITNRCAASIGLDSSLGPGSSLAGSGAAGQVR